MVGTQAGLVKELNSIPLGNSGIAGWAGSCNNDCALADLRHGTGCVRWEQRPTCIFWQAFLLPRATGG
jgi:hypothetical protein